VRLFVGRGKITPVIPAIVASIQAVPCRHANATAGSRIAGALCMANQWTEMERQARESITRLHELIAEAHTLSETLEARSRQRTVLSSARPTLTTQPAARRGAPCS